MKVFELFKESFGVGVVASKKQAKDPRYSHSLTKDVRPDTPKKNRKALGLTESPRADGSFENRDEYYKEMYPMALKAVSKLGLQIPPELLVTQWGFESGWGSKVSGNNNFFGLKANKGYKGDSKEVATHEYEDGKKVNIKDKFRSYDSLDDAVDDYVDFIKNNPRYTEAGVFDAKNSEEYMAALQKAGYATDPKYADKILKQEKITKKQIAKVVPPEEQEKLKAEQPTVSTTPGAAKAEPEYDAFGNVVTAKGFDPDNKKAQQAANSVARQARRDDAIDAEVGGADAAGATPTPASEYDDVKDAFGSEEDAALQDKQAEELSKTYAERGKESLNNDRLDKEEAELKRLQTELEYAGTEDAFGGERQSEEEVAAQKKELEREIDVKKRAIAFIKDPGMMSDGGGSMTPEQLEFLKAKEKEDLEIKQAKEEGREPDPTLIGNKSVGELELDAARAYRYAAQAEKEGKPEVAAAARKEADANMKVRQDMVDVGVTWMSGAGNPDQAQRTIDDVKAGNTTGINMFQKPEGKEREQFQQNQAEADRQDAEKGEGAWDRTSTLDDEKKKVDPTPLNKRPQAEPEKPKSTTAAKTSYSGAVASTGGASSKGGGYGQGAEVDATVSATPKVDPYPNPGYTGEELRIYNKLSDSQKAKVIGDFEKSKKYTAQQRKNITPRTGPQSIPDPKPRSLKDIKHQQTLSKIEGGTQLVDPAKAREVSKILGMSSRTPEDKKKRDAALDAIRFKAPSMAELQKGMTPIVDKSTTYKPDRNANLANNKIGDAYGALSKPTSSIGRATVSTTPRTGPGANANKQTFNAEKQKAERQAKIDQQKAERQAKIDQQKAEQAAKKAEQKAKQEARKAEDERKRQERQAEQERRVSGSTQTVGGSAKFNPRGGPVGESAIFRAIMRK
jgi:flagellum-specific peptidoglycan hydrolase FlgJ